MRILALLFVLLWSSAASANVRADDCRKVVRGDGGGMIGWRIDEIRDLDALGCRIEIRGQCLSSCTLYLGAKNVCIHRRAIFGFHGPSFFGVPLSEGDFDNTSRIMAAYYPAPLARWFMEVGRYRLNSYYTIRADTLIAMGVPEC